MILNDVEKKRSAKTRRRISETLKGHRCSGETRGKISAAAKKRFVNPENHPMFGKKHSEKSIKKISKSLMGENNPNWRGGISLEIYPREFNRRLKKKIRERDSNTCQLCGKTKEPNGRKLSVHHIDYDKKNSDPKNLITLCHSCNKEVDGGNKEFWVRFFKNFIIRKGL